MKTGHKYVSNKAWEKYTRIVTSFMNHDTGRQDILWAKKINQMQIYGEDTNEEYEAIMIEALCFYNAFRNWPINKDTVSGELDDENLSIMITKDYLMTRGYINKNGYWDFNWAEDRFIINGITYKPAGDTPVSQVKDDSIVFLLILKRDRDTNLPISKFINAYCDNEGITFRDINSKQINGKV